MKKEIKTEENNVKVKENILLNQGREKALFEKSIKENQEKLEKLESLLDEKAKLEKEIQGLEREIQDINNSKPQFEKQAEEAKKARDTQKELVEKAKKDLSEEEEKLAQLKKSIKDKEMKLDALKDKDQTLKNLESEKEAIQRKIETNKNDLERLNQESKKTQEIYQNTEASIKTLKENLSKLEEEEKMGLESDKPMAVSLEQVKLDKKALEDSIKEIDAQIKKLDIEIKNLREEIAKKKLLLASLEVKPIAETINPLLPKNKIKVKNIEKLTEKEKEEIKNNIEKINKDNFPKGTQVIVDDKGNVTITYSDKSKDMIKSEMLVFQESKGASTEIEKPEKPISEIIKANLPKNKIVVKDKNNLSEKEKAELASEVKKANPYAKNIEITKDGKVIITYADGSKNIIGISELISEKTKNIGKGKLKPANPSENRKNKKANPEKTKAKNPKMGIESQGSIILSLIASAAGAFALKKRK